MSILKEVINNIKVNRKLDISNFGVFEENIYTNLMIYKPYNELISNIVVYFKNDCNKIYQITFGVSDYLNIIEAEELLGEYYTAYNWRDYFTRFTFNGIQNEYIEAIYFEKNNEIIVDKEKNQYIEDDHSGNVTSHDYNELSFDGFVIKYK